MQDPIFEVITGTAVTAELANVDKIKDEIEQNQVKKEELKRQIAKIDTTVEKLSDKKAMWTLGFVRVLAEQLAVLNGQWVCINQSGYQMYGKVKSVMCGGKPGKPELTFYFFLLVYQDGYKKFHEFREGRNNQTLVLPHDLLKLQNAIRLANDEERFAVSEYCEKN